MILSLSYTRDAVRMNRKGSRLSRAHESKSFQSDGPNWILIAGGALLSTLSVRVGYKLKQALDARQQTDARSTVKGNGTSTRRRSPGCDLRPNMGPFSEDDDGYFNFRSGNESMGGKHPSNGQLLSESDIPLPLVTVPAPDYSKENGVAWASSPELLELPPRPFQSNCSDSPCVSESGSDIFSKREVVQKLRQQLKRRDDMIMEMQDQIIALQNSLQAQLAHSSHLQSQLDMANRDLFDSEREVQRLRKVIADHCVGNAGTNENTATIWPSNGHANGYVEDEEINSEPSDKARADERIEMLKREVGELKEVIEGKEYLLQNYKEQKAELSLKIKELQQRLDSQLPHIL